MSERRRALGRGLSALLPSTPTDQGPQELPLTSLVASKQQPRQGFDQEKLQELADSIRQHGVIQPITVTPVMGSEPLRYRVVAGERRWRAATLAGLAMIPAVVRYLDEREALEIALVENLQREDLNPMEVARGYRELQNSFGLSQEQLAERVGRSRPTVANTMRLLHLPEDLQGLVETGALNEGQARALLALPSPEAQSAAAKRVITGELTVRRTEALVKKLLTEPAPTAAMPTRREPEREVQDEALLDSLRRHLGTKVDLTRGPNGGRMVIHFYSDEELTGILDAMGFRV